MYKFIYIFCCSCNTPSRLFLGVLCVVQSLCFIGTPCGWALGLDFGDLCCVGFLD
jgi:hypothetical protein